MKFAPYMYALSKTIFLEKQNFVAFQNGITDFYLVSFWFRPKLKKKKKKNNNNNNNNTFPKEFFNEIRLKIGEHEYIYITEIKFLKNPFQNGGQYNFDIAQLC